MKVEYQPSSTEALLMISPVEIQDEASYKCEITYLEVRENCDVVQIIKLTTLGEYLWSVRLIFIFAVKIFVKTYGIIPSCYAFFVFYQSLLNFILIKSNLRELTPSGRRRFGNLPNNSRSSPVVPRVNLPRVLPEFHPSRWKVRPLILFKRATFVVRKEFASFRRRCRRVEIRARNGENFQIRAVLRVTRCVYPSGN